MLMYRKIIILIVLTVLNLIAVAQKKSYTAARIKDKAPEIDGQFDDNAWSIVEWQDDFTQNQPKNGEKPSQKTCFKILYD